MNLTTVCGLWGAMAVGLGLYGMIVSPQPLRRILAFDLLGSGVFLLLGVVARRGAAAGFGGDPVGQALVITGVVVAFAATALTGGAVAPPAPGDGRGHPPRRRAGERRHRDHRRLMPPPVPVLDGMMPRPAARCSCWRSCCR